MPWLMYAQAGGGGIRDHPMIECTDSLPLTNQRLRRCVTYLASHELNWNPISIEQSFIHCVSCTVSM